MLFWTRVGNTAVWSVCFSERWADYPSSWARVNCSGFCRSRGTCCTFPARTQGHSDRARAAGTLPGSQQHGSALLQCTGRRESRAQARGLQTRWKTRVALRRGLLCSGKSNSRLEQHRWQQPPQTRDNGLRVSGNSKWLMFAQLCFQCLSGRFFILLILNVTSKSIAWKVLLNLCLLFYLLIFCLSFSLLP